MNWTRTRKFLFAVVLSAMALASSPALACSACYGDPDSSMSKGLAWGMTALLGVVVLVLGGITTFFVYIAKKSPTDKD